MNFQRILVPLFTFVWWNRLWYEMPNHYFLQAHVIKVKSWRSALLDVPGSGRQRVAFCFWWFK